MQSNYLIIAGGEPLLHQDILMLVREASRHGLFPYLMTNGILLNEKLIKKLKQEGLVAIRFTLDSLSKQIQDGLKGEGSLEKIIQAMNLSNAEEIGVNINVPVGEHNYAELDEIVQFCISNKVRTLRFSPLVDSSQDFNKAVIKRIISLHEKYVEKLYYNDYAEYKGYQDFLKTIESSVCPGGIISININPDGNVTKCPYDDQNILGNINNESLYSIWMGGYSSNVKSADKCSVINFDPVDLFVELEEYFSKDIKRCISAWVAQIENKKKLCYRDLPCWYFTFL
ncbi:MAG: radical SAM protein [Oscillospiraceae bacterium]|nr:radical SAM protein [Oscillospiraceae bacterium]